MPFYWQQPLWLPARRLPQAAFAAETTETADAAAATEEAAAEETAEAAAATEDAAAKTPKYVFLFIGDGMSYPQIQTTNYYLNAIEDDGDDILTSESKLNMRTSR